MRRTTLRGWENLNKRYKLAAAFYNLSQLMRKLFGFGTPKQLAALGRLFFLQWTCFLGLLAVMAHQITSADIFNVAITPEVLPNRCFVAEQWKAREKLAFFNRLLGHTQSEQGDGPG